LRPYKPLWSPLETVPVAAATNVVGSVLVPETVERTILVSHKAPLRNGQQVLDPRNTLNRKPEAQSLQQYDTLCTYTMQPSCPIFIPETGAILRARYRRRRLHTGNMLVNGFRKQENRISLTRRRASTLRTEESLFLRNNSLEVEFLPAFGGKIVSLRSVRTGEQFLLPPLKDYRHLPPNAEFSEGDCGGFDDCLPSVASCARGSGQVSVPDHGDLWRVAWRIGSRNERVELHADASSRPLRLTRKGHLRGSSLILEYSLTNLSNSPTLWLWSAHPLFRVEAGDRIVLPTEIHELNMEYSAGNILGTDRQVSWPHAVSNAGVPVNLSVVGDKDGVTAHKLFARMGPHGWAGLYRAATKQGIVIRFDTSVLPFLGLWICFGAWPAQGAAKQYTVAIEPTTSDTDSLLIAEESGTAPRLAAGQSCSWNLEIELLGDSAPIDLDGFSRGLE
jgi:galactose mutarotase-like enzyme